MKLKIIFSLFIIAGCLKAGAQQTMSRELKEALGDKKNFREVMQVITDYYVQKHYTTNPKMFSEFKKWNRWAWYQCRHLDANGNMVNSAEKNQPVFDSIQLAGSNLNTTSPLSNTGAWSSIGPANVSNGIGRVDRLAFHPTNPNIMYAGATAGGLWVTNNDGASWNALTAYVPQLGVSGIVVDADNPNILYVLSGDGDSYANGGFIYQRSSIGILKSTDAGASWSKLSNILPAGSPAFFGFKLIQSPDFHNRFFACTSDGLYRSIDYGLTWTRDATIGVNNVFDIEAVPNTGYVYACTQKDVYVSANWGNPFVHVPNGAFSQQPTVYTQRTALAISPNAPNTLYVLFGGQDANNAANNVKLLYRSNNNATSFTLVNSGAPITTGYACTMAVNPADINNVIIGNVSLLSSSNGGVSFPNTGSGVHADFHDLAYNPINNFLYAGCDGGVYRSCCSNGVFWSAGFAGLNITQYYHMACFEGNDGLALEGAQDNGVHLRNGSSSFTSVNTGDGFDAKFVNNNSNIAYYSLNAGVFKYTVSTNQSLLKLNPSGNIDDQNFFFPSIATHPTNSNIIYAGYISGVYRTTNDGANWTNLGQTGSAGFAAAGGLAVSANLPDRLYASNGSSLSRSDNQGTSWTTISGTAGWPGGALTITDVQTRNNNANEVWVTFGGYGTAKVVYSSNAGASWTNYTGSLPDLPVYCIEYTNTGDAYIGTDAGVYFMDFNMSDWVFFSNGLPMIPVTELVANETNGSIKAATFGRGIWQSDLYSDCGPLLLLGGTVLGTNFYQSAGVIETTQQLPGSLGNSVKYRSPTKITLKPGFRAYNNSKLDARIGPCGQGVFRSAKDKSVISKSDFLKLIINYNKDSAETKH